MKSETDTIAFSGSAEFADVGSGRKNSLATGDDNRARWISREVESNLFNAGQHGLAQSIDFGIVESNDGNPIRATFK